MSRPIRKLIEGEWPEAISVCDPDSTSPLASLRGYTYRGRPLLEHTWALLEVLHDHPPPPSEGLGRTNTPWWHTTPSVYLTALLLHIGLPEVAEPGKGLPAHGRRSARKAREILREAGCPFTVREHAAALIANQGKPSSLLGSGALAETYMEFACTADLRVLYRLKRAEAEVAGREKAIDALDSFRDKLRGLDCFGVPPEPPVTEEVLGELEGAEPAGRHRALNALRYFRLVARMNEPEWYAERLRQEMDYPDCRLHLLVGPAGSGKSSWAREHLGETVIISSDQMRRELTGDPSDQSQNYLVFQRCMDRVREELHRGREVTFDATNYREKLRQMPLQAGRWSGAEIVSYFFDVPLEESLRRNRQRKRSVPERIIRRHYRLLELPGLYEADRHLRVDTEGATHAYWPCAEAEGD